MSCPTARRARFGLPHRAGLLLALAAAAYGQRNSGDIAPTSPSETLRPATITRQPIFFPPNPPPLGRPVGRMAGPSENRVPAPPELAAYANEIFYPALGSRLFTQSLKEPLRRQLDAYRATKLALQNELRSELHRLQGAESPVRAEALRKLAQAQAAKLGQLEADAEQLRRDLALTDHAWGALREWRLGDRDRRGFSPWEIAQVMRGYAFFQNGLLAGQRRLLREIALELMMAAEDVSKASAAQPHVFFPPEPARVSFPADLPPEAAAKLAAFQTKKSALKKELYDAIYRHDGEAFSFLRGNTMSALAHRQSARFAELEQLAEDVRRALPSLADAAKLEPSPLPVALQTRVETMIAGYLEAQKTATARIEASIARAKGLPLQSNYRFDPDGLKFLVVPTRLAGRDPAVLKKIEAVRAEISAVAEDYGRTLADLLNDRTALRTDIGTALGLTKAETIDATVFTAMRLGHLRQTAASYDEYRLAVFEPGLSPEQRRLLFDGVIEKLDLPLPRGELQPTRRGDSW